MPLTDDSIAVLCLAGRLNRIHMNLVDKNAELGLSLSFSIDKARSCGIRERSRHGEGPLFRGWSPIPWPADLTQREVPPGWRQEAIP